jgi:hypothetical protein
LHPDLYLAVSNLLITALTALLLFYAGKKVFQYTNSVFYAILVQTATFLPVIWYDLIGRVVPELLMAFPVVLLTVLIIKIYYRNENINNFDVFLFALISAFGISVKLTYLPLWLIPLIVLSEWKKKLIYLSSAVLLFFIIAFPVTVQFEIFWGWIKDLLMHSGHYGKGDTNILDINAFMLNMAELFYYEKKYFAIFFGLILLYRYLSYYPHQKKGKANCFITLAVVIAVAVQLLMVGKHYAHRYFIPVLMLSPLMVFLTVELIKKLWRHKAAVYLVNIGIAVFLTVADKNKPRLADHQSRKT